MSDHTKRETGYIIAFFTVQTALDHLRRIDHKKGQAAVEAFSALARDKSDVVEERDAIRRENQTLQQRIEELEGALGDIYPVLAGRCIRLQEEGEERAAATWDGYCRRIAAALNQTEEADHE